MTEESKANLLNQQITFIMKNLTLKLMSLALFTAIFYSCQENEQPFVHPIIGEWESDAGQPFIQLYLEGVEKTPSEFGMEVFQLNETDARIFMEEYLQNQVLGPINLGSGKIVFDGNNSFRTSGSQGIWSLFNSDTRLRLKAENLPLDQYDFDILTLSANKLELKFDATFELIEEGANEVYNFMVLINLTK